MNIDVSGGALESGQLENIRIGIRRGEAGFRNGVVVDVPPGGGSVVPDLDIPRGAADLGILANHAALQASAGDVYGALSFRLELEADTRLRGDREFRLRVAPAENPRGEVAWTVPVSVS